MATTVDATTWVSNWKTKGDFKKNNHVLYFSFPKNQLITLLQTYPDGIRFRVGKKSESHLNKDYCLLAFGVKHIGDEYIDQKDAQILQSNANPEAYIHLQATDVARAKEALAKKAFDLAVLNREIAELEEEIEKNKDNKSRSDQAKKDIMRKNNLKDQLLTDKMPKEIATFWIGEYQKLKFNNDGDQEVANSRHLAKELDGCFAKLQGVCFENDKPQDLLLDFIKTATGNDIFLTFSQINPTSIESINIQWDLSNKVGLTTFILSDSENINQVLTQSNPKLLEFGQICPPGC
jgi:hypothetical protein